MFDSKTKTMPYVMWAIPVLFFAYQFILRLWPGLMMNQIMEQFAIEASAFGLLAASYYYGYAGMQIPVAILLDRFGVRLVVFCFAMICGLATLQMVYTDNFIVAVICRFLIGAGSAVGFLSVSKVVGQWFPKDAYARMIGLSFTLGLMGAIYGGRPVSLMIDAYSWQTVAVILALVSIALSVAAALVLREKSQDDAPTMSWHNFRQILMSRTLWVLALANLLLVGSLEGFADVWGVQYLMTAYGLEKADAATYVSFIYFGMLFGGPLLVWVAKHFGNYQVIAVCGVGMATLFLMLFFTISASWFLIGVFFFMGILCCYQVLVFAAGSELVSSQNLGVTVAFLNCVNMFGGSVFHTVIGQLMDLAWTGSLDAGGLRVYELATYQTALSIIPVSAVLGSGIILGLLTRKASSLVKVSG